MNSDDLTRPTLNDGEDDKDTQATITAVFRLLREVKQDVEEIGPRLNEIELRRARDFETLNLRVTEGFRELSNKLEALNKSRLQAEADYIGLLERVTELESKAS